jgi:hypothetical protein
MKPINKQSISLALIITGLFFTYACGHESYGEYGYKANGSIDTNNSPTMITNTASSPSEMAVGDVYSVTFDDQNEGLIDFEGTDYDSNFILAVGALDTAQVSRTIQLSDESIPFEANSAKEDDNWTEIDAQEALDQQLRGAEMMISQDPEYQKASFGFSSGKAMGEKAIAEVGDIETFKVLSGLSSLSSYQDVQAEARCVGTNVIFYVDTQVVQYNGSDLTDSDVDSLCEMFDDVAGKEFEAFGEPSDIDNNGRVAVLMTPQVNKLGAMGGGIITGFFFANDLYTSANSNMKELIYVIVPDSNGVYGLTIPKSFAMQNLLPAVLPHELQHAINYNQKVFVNGGVAEENWMNEALSHFSEDFLGYGHENPSRIEVYLEDTELYGPISAGSPNLAERGAAYLFLRFLYEQADNGEQFIWDLLHSDLIGAQNLEASFNGKSEDFDQVSEFLMRWSAAMAMSSFNLSSDERFSYKERTWNPETNHWEGICLNCNTEDGRGTILKGITLSPYYGVSQLTVESSAVKFYQITSFPSEIHLQSDTSGQYGAMLIRYQ